MTTQVTGDGGAGKRGFSTRQLHERAAGAAPTARATPIYLTAGFEFDEAPLARIVLSPLTRFLKFWLVRGGWRDGLPGFVHIVIGCQNSFMKYVKLRELCRSRGQG